MKKTDFARYLTQFLSTYLPGQVGSKRNTQLAYRDSFSLFLRFDFIAFEIDRLIIIKFILLFLAISGYFCPNFLSRFPDQI